MIYTSHYESITAYDSVQYENEMRLVPVSFAYRRNKKPKNIAN